MNEFKRLLAWGVVAFLVWILISDAIEALNHKGSGWVTDSAPEYSSHSGEEYSAPEYSSHSGEEYTFKLPESQYKRWHLGRDVVFLTIIGLGIFKHFRPKRTEEASKGAAQ